MSGLLENPVVHAALRRTGGPKGHSLLFNFLVKGCCFALFILVPMAFGVCGCTMFAIAGVAMILATSLGIGNSAFGALTVEREKRTLDSLRLTQLSSHEVLLGKLLPEFGALTLTVAVMAPTVIVAGLWGAQGWIVTFGAVGFAVLAGLFSSVLAIHLSSMFATTSQAVVAGWITRGVWLLLTPMLDVVVAAVFVQNVSPPVFTSINPLAAFGVLAVPEAASGIRLWLPLIYPVATIGLGVLLWIVTARRFAGGMANNGGLRDKVIHPVYRKGFGPSLLTRLFPVLKENPSFLRELSSQIRAGAGRWPGYLVFLVLFLAPTFYARSWTLNDLKFAYQQQQTRHVELTKAEYTYQDNGARAATPGPNKLTLKIHSASMYEPDMAVRVEGHTATGCMRLCLFQCAGVRMPEGSLRWYAIDKTSTYADRGSGVTARPAEPSTTGARVMGLGQSSKLPRDLSEESREMANRSSLHVGLAGATALLLLYLCIRFSAFLATAVTGERSRRTWEDLALTGMSVREAMKGKVVGAILLPAIQMTAVFPVLGLFVYWGNLEIYDVVALYVYALALSVTAAMLGLWASSRTSTSHDAHLRALCLVMAAFFLLPLMVSGLQAVLIPLAVVGALVSTGRPTGFLAWVCVAAALTLAPQAISPLTAAVSFMPSLTTSNTFLHLLGVAPANMVEALTNLVCAVLLMVSLSVVLWNSAIARLTDGRDSDAIAAEERENGLAQLA